MKENYEVVKILRTAIGIVYRRSNTQPGLNRTHESFQSFIGFNCTLFGWFEVFYNEYERIVDITMTTISGLKYTRIRL